MPNIGLRLSSICNGEVDQNFTSVWQIPICFWRYRTEVSLPDLGSQALASGWLHCPPRPPLAITSLPSQKWQCLGLIHITLDLPLPQVLPRVTLRAVLCELVSLAKSR